LHCPVGLFIVDSDGNDGDIVIAEGEAAILVGCTARAGQNLLRAVSPTDRG